MPKPGGKGSPSPPPDFSISANPISTGGGTDNAPTLILALRFLDPPTACYLVSRVDVGQELHSICDRFTSFVKKSVNVNYFILENNLELVMFRVWNYYAMQMSTNIFILQMFFLYLWFNLKTICQYGSKV